MRYRVTTKTGEVHEFNSPFLPHSLRKSMNLPLTHKIEVLPDEDRNHSGTVQEIRAPAADSEAQEGKGGEA
jgi:hypothetical protein